MLPGQEEEVNEAIYRQHEAASKSHSPVLLGDFNYPDICCRTSTVKHKQPRRLLESMDANILTQAVENFTGNGVLFN